MTVDIFQRKHFKKANINKKNLSDRQINDLDLILERYGTRDGIIKRIAFMIQYNVPDIFDCFDRHEEIIRNREQVKNIQNIRYIYGDEIAEAIREYRRRKGIVTKTGTTDIAEQYILNRKFFQMSGITFKTMTSIQIDRIRKLLSVYTKYDLDDWDETVSNFIKNDLTNYVGRIKRLKKMPASPTLLAFVLRYGKTNGLAKYNLVNERKTKHFENTISFWFRNGMNENEAIEAVTKVQSERGKLASLKIKGSSEYTVRSMQYWLKIGYSKEDAKRELKRVCTSNGLSFYIRKYGETEGPILFNNRINQWLMSYNDNDMEDINKRKSHSVEGGLLRGLTVDAAVENNMRMKKHLKKIRTIPYSIISQELFNLVDDNIETLSFFATKNHEINFDGFSVDYYDLYSETVIEFYGDYYHRNPNKFASNYKSLNITSENKWKMDEFRINKIKNNENVRNIIIVWEEDYNKNKNKILESIINTIKENKNVD